MTDLLIKKSPDEFAIYDPLDDEEPIFKEHRAFGIVGVEGIVQFLNELGNDVAVEDVESV